MTKNCFIFDVRNHQLSVHDHSAVLDVAPDRTLTRSEVEEFLDQINYQNEPVAILLDRSMVMTTTMVPPARAALSTIRYTLEERIPLDAEEMYVTFLPNGKNETLACVVTRESMEFVNRFLEEGINVKLVMPFLIAAVEELLAQDKECRNSNLVFEYENESMLDLIQVERNVFTRWTTTGQSQQQLEQQLMFQSWKRQPTRLVSQLDPPTVQLDFAKRKDFDVRKAVANRTKQILSKARKTSFDFLPQIIDSKDALVSSESSSHSPIALALIMLLVAVGGSLLFAGKRYQAASQQNRSELEKIFVQQFDDSSSRKMQRRFGVKEAANKKLKASKSITEFLGSVEGGQVIENHLVSFLRELPLSKQSEGHRYQLVQFDIDRDGISATVQAKSAADINWLKQQMPNWSINTKKEETVPGSNRSKKFTLHLTRSKS